MKRKIIGILGGNWLLRKSITIVIIILFLFCNVSFTTLSDENNNPTIRTLYVGGSGPGNYTKIQDAIDDASYGDTVFVYNGTYSDYSPENNTFVKITKVLI